ncbi:MAG: nicotinate (nicotinamide) nucleotide adenylyltransferase [Acidobacteria bacterium]|nr:MAG: nicotinate (nicotinamide) nucleotide adenylyltransferase [Acidobacteriota bacterium]
MKIGLFGGTFDPPHKGHTAVAAAARDALGLDRVEVVPCAGPPHRPPATAGPFDRFAMAVLAFLDFDRLVVSPREIARGGISYTVETLRELQSEWPGAELFLIVGGDSYDELPTWRDAQEIERLAHLAVVGRPGAGGLDAVRPADRPRLREPGEPAPPGCRAVYRVPMAPQPVSASAIRRTLARGGDPGAVLDPRVRRYIEKRALYHGA